MAVSPLGGLNVRSRDGGLEILFSPLETVDETLEVLDGERVVFATAVTAKPLEPWAKTVSVAVPAERLRVRIGGNRLEWKGDPKAGELSRPLQSPADFDWNSVYGLWLKGKELIRQRSYAPAGEALETCLRLNPHYVPALGDLALLRLFAMDAKGAFDLARRALAVDTYDPTANYYYGLAARRLGRLDDARDGFELAAQSVELRGAAWTELAKLALHAGDLERAGVDAGRGLDFNQRNLEARRLLALVLRLQGRRDEARTALDALLALDPLNSFGGFEKALAEGGEAARRTFTASVRNEMPQETFLELAAWYHGVGRAAEAGQVLELAPQTAEVLYWRARLETSDDVATALLQQAEEASPERVFPFRAETAEVLQWAISRSSGWRPRYYLALVHWGVGNLDEARRLFDQCGEQPDYAPFYAARALVFEGVSPERSLADLQQAARRDPAQWRFGKMLVERQLRQGTPAVALETARRYCAQSPENYILGMLHAKALLAVGRYQEAAERLTRLQVLPYEGATEGRRLYRQAQLMVAVENLRKDDAARALRSVDAARLWPENLGAGKPYPEDVDERLEDFLAAQGLSRSGDHAAASKMLQQITARGPRGGGADTLVRALALRQTGRAAEGSQLLDDWSAREPASALAAWAVRAYNGQAGSPLPDTAGEELRVLAAWLGTAQP